MASLAAAGVALVILIDLATGQGPPVYSNYLRAQPHEAMMPAPPPMAMQHIPGRLIPASAYEAPKDYPMPPTGSKLDEEKGKPKDKYGEVDGYGGKEGYKKEAYGKEGNPKELEKKHKKLGDESGPYKTTKAPGLYDRIMKNFG